MEREAMKYYCIDLLNVKLHYSDFIKSKSKF